MRAELLEKMCEEKGIITATPEKKGWNSGLSPLNAIGGGFSSLSPMRVFRSGSASPKKKNTPPASPSRKSKLNNDGPFAVTATKTKKEEEEEGRRRTRRSSRQRKRHRRRRQKSLVRLFLRLLLSRRLPRLLRPPRTPLQSIGNRIAYVRKRKTRHLQRRSTLLTSSSPSSNGKKSNGWRPRENERVKEGKYGVVTPYENSPTETPRRKTSGERERQDREEEDKDVVSMDEVVHSLGQM